MSVASTAHFEHGLPLLAKLDLPKLLEAYNRLQAAGQDLEAVSSLVAVIGGGAEARILSKLSAVQRATSKQLFDSEGDPKILKELEREASDRPFTECLADAAAFFVSLGLSVPATPSSSVVEDGNPSGAESPATPAASL